MARLIRRRRRHLVLEQEAAGPVRTIGRVVPAEAWTDFDSLPADLKLAIAETTQPVNPHPAVEMYRKLVRGNAFDPGRSPAEAARLVVDELRKREAGEIAAFASRYELQHRQPYAHVAASATIQRYGRR